MRPRKLSSESFLRIQPFGELLVRDEMFQEQMRSGGILFWGVERIPFHPGETSRFMSS